MKGKYQTHLTDEEVTDFILGDLPIDQVQKIDQHLATCKRCATMLESFYEVQATFPVQAWSSHRQRFVTELRQRVGLAQKSTWLNQLAGQLQGLTFLSGNWVPSLAVAQAATGELIEDGQTADGSLRWHFSEDEERNLVIRFGSHHIDLAGIRLRISIGEWHQDLILQKVAPNQVGAETLLSVEQRSHLAIDAALRVEMRIDTVDAG